MALMRCSDCGNEVSDQAPACPKCGRPIASAANAAASAVGVVASNGGRSRLLLGLQVLGAVIAISGTGWCSYTIAAGPSPAPIATMVVGILLAATAGTIDRMRKT